MASKSASVPAVGAALARTLWLTVAVAGAAVAGRVAPRLPTWAWVSGGLFGALFTGFWLWPSLTLGAVIVAKQAAPNNGTMFVIGALLAVIGLLRGGWRRVPPVPGVLFVAYFVLALSTMKTTLAPWEHIQIFTVPGTGLEVAPIRSYEIYGTIALASIAGFALVAGAVVRRGRDLENMMLAMAFGASVPIAMGIFDRLRGRVVSHDGYASVMSVFTHPNQFAVYLVGIVPILVAFAVTAERRAVRRVTWAIVAGGLLCLLLTYTRSAWVAIAVGGLVGGLLAGRVRAVAIVAFIGVALAFGTGTGQSVVDRFQGVSWSTEAAPTDSWSWRLVQWSRVLHQTPSYQMSGTGFSTYERRAVEVFGLQGGQIRTTLQSNWRQGFGAHNDFVETYVELGIPGLVLWSGFISAVLGAAGRAWKRTRDPLAIGAFSSMLGLIIMSASDNVQSYDLSYGFTAAVVVGLYSMRGARPGLSQGSSLSDRAVAPAAELERTSV